MLYYLIYQITNHQTGKIYIGCHVTKNQNDGYMGSGRNLKLALQKYGTAVFEKKILASCRTRQEMFDLECKLVDETFLKRKDVYNVRKGGKGGSWDHVNSNSELQRAKARLSNASPKRKTPEYREKLSTKNRATTLAAWAAGKYTYRPVWKGRRHTPETRLKISLTKRGKQTTSMLGKHHSEATKQKIREGVLRTRTLKTGVDDRIRTGDCEGHNLAA